MQNNMQDAGLQMQHLREAGQHAHGGVGLRVRLHAGQQVLGELLDVARLVEQRLQGIYPSVYLSTCPSLCSLGTRARIRCAASR